jgi:hypothetical protein
MGAGMSNIKLDSNEFVKHLRTLDMVYTRAMLHDVAWYCGCCIAVDAQQPVLQLFCTDLRTGFFDCQKTQEQLLNDQRLLGKPEDLDWQTFFGVARQAFLAGNVSLQPLDHQMLLSIVLDPADTDVAGGLKWILPLEVSKVRNWRRELLPKFIDSLFDTTRKACEDIASAYNAERTNLESRLAELREKRKGELRRSNSKTNLVAQSLPTSPRSQRRLSDLKLMPSDVDANSTDDPRSNSRGSSSSVETDEATSPHIVGGSVTVPVEKVLDVLKRIRTKLSVQRAAIGTMSSLVTRSDIDDLDYVLDVLATGSLYFPDFTEEINEKTDDEVTGWIASELVSKDTPIAATRPGKKVNRGYETLKRVSKAIAFASTLRKQTETSVTMRIWADVPDRLRSIINRIDDWSFDVFELNRESMGRPLYYVVYSIVQRMHLHEKFSITSEKLSRFLTKVESLYHANPYHNNIHAADVVQTMYWFMRNSTFAQNLSPLEQFASIIAAAIHDISHPGVNNAFEIKTQSRRAVVYSDQSVLEMFHLCSFFELMGSSKEMNLLEDLSPQERKAFRDQVISMVLMTDMSKHFTFLGQFKAMMKRGFKPDAPEDVTMVLQGLIKASDISNTVKPGPVYHKWVDRVMTEFFLQGDKERELGLPISPFCDRTKTVRSKCQISFMDFITLPFFTTLAEFEPRLQTCCEHLQSNKKFWLEHPDA